MSSPGHGVENSSTYQPLFDFQANQRPPTSFKDKQGSSMKYGKENWNSDAASVGVRHIDPYSRHTVASGSQRPTSAPCRLEVQDSSEHESTTSIQSDTSRNSSPTREMRRGKKITIKRKVLRKTNGEVKVCDESSVSEADSDAISDLGQRITKLQTYAEETEECETEGDDTSSSVGRSSISEERPHSAHPLFGRGLWHHRQLENEDSTCTSNRPKSFIRPVMDHPHTRNLKKTDPVAKYFQYKQDWEAFKAPGEQDRKELRWGIKEQMLYRSQPVSKPTRIYIPNNYVVPTQKKRSTLRWEVRHDLANGVMPQKFYPL
uniref:HYLS1 centriolar and ciliosis associated n=2 Tax=Latimeria chalumnae TaxID=7897 RepID=M3XHW6_LATCH|nr:PREDICTED: hydrolethalus syndrome protein 1 [Latimeria chalumnae]|eukprot:XP_014342332.1 PREDICTED: hydrolethalus syndrome protein 1 [Latimeria chalumnae]